MWVIVVCSLLVLAGLAAVVRWGGLAVASPPAPAPVAAGPVDAPPVGLVVRRYLWYVAVAMASGKANVVDVVTAVAETEVAVEPLVSGRDRVIQAYEEIMRMPI